MSNSKVTVIDSRVYKVYFRSSTEDAMEVPRGEVMACVVIAADIEDAIRKAHEAFPGMKIGSCFTDTLDTGGYRLEKVVL